MVKEARLRVLHQDPRTAHATLDDIRIPYYFGREFKDNRIFHAMGHNVVYRLVVSFHSPVTDKEEMVVSEPYGTNVASYVSDSKVAVHYSKDGEYWIEI